MAELEELISFKDDDEVKVEPLTPTMRSPKTPLTLQSPVEFIRPQRAPTMQTSPQRRGGSTHARSYSWVVPVSPHSKQMSVSFPVSIASISNTPRIPQWQASIAPTTALPPLDAMEPANDPAQFLTVLASQERKVLELKDEMTKADAELEKLKRKWALHEATRKRTEPVGGHARLAEAADEIPAAVKEARRRSAGTNLGGKTRRTTFSSTKHTRTLSLLSPDRKNFHSFPQPADVWDDEVKPLAAALDPTSKFESGYEKSLYGDLDRKRGGHQDALIATGKQMAEDFKEGLWTFIDDLRQATIGEEGGAQMQPGLQKTIAAGANATPQKTRKSSASSTPAKSIVRSKSTKTKSGPKATKLIDIGDEFWNELDPSGPLSGKTENEEVDPFAEEVRTVRKSHVKPESTRWSSSTILSDMASGAMSPADTNVSTPRTSTSTSRSRESSPTRPNYSDRRKSTAELLASLSEAHSQQQNAALWGSVVNAANPLSYNLKKTATAFLSQVEKSLAPPISPTVGARSGYVSPKSKDH